MQPISFLATDDAAKARYFYATLLELSLVEEGPYALVFDSQGHRIRIQIVEDLSPAPFTVHGWFVDDIEAKARSLRSKGIAFETYRGLHQDELGIWISPAGAKIAWFKDPSGNVLSITQMTA